MSEPRKASDILLSLETKIDQLVKINAVLDLDNKIIANRLNTVIETLSKQGITIPAVTNTAAPKTETDPLKPTISVAGEFKLPMQKGPQQSYGRTSRSETFENVAAAPSTVDVIPQIKAPKIIQNDLVSPTPTVAAPAQPQVKAAKLPGKIDTSTKVAVGQRIVNSQGKAVFLANIDIIESNTKEVISKARTNSLGKWSAVVPIGQYDIVIKKMNVDTKELIEITQHALVDGTENPLNLDIAIIK